MSLRRNFWVAFFLVLCGTQFGSGCLSIDRTPLWGQPFYQKTQTSLEQVRIQFEGGEPLMAGAARIDITPAVGIPLAGYGKRMGRSSTGIHDRLYSRALALSDGDQTVLILANDLLAITDDIYNAVYQEINQEIPITRDSLMITASHTHSGPGALAKKFWESFAAGPLDPAFFTATVQKMAKAALQAHQEMRPVRMAGGSIPVPDLIRNRTREGGPTDPALGFLIFQALDQSATIYLVNYSAHATVLKHNNYRFSGDYPGALARHLEETDDVIALFTAGAVADLTARPPDGRDDFDRAEQMGRILAQKVLEASHTAEFRERVTIGAIRAEIYLPPTQVRVGPDRRLVSPLGNLFFDRESAVQAILIGGFLLVGVPCDLGSEIGLEIKQQARVRGSEALIVGFANDYIGYVIPERDYQKSTYEARMSFNGPFMDSYLTEIASDLIRRLTADREMRSDD